MYYHLPRAVSPTPPPPGSYDPYTNRRTVVYGCRRAYHYWPRHTDSHDRSTYHRIRSAHHGSTYVTATPRGSISCKHAQANSNAQAGQQDHLNPLFHLHTPWV